MSGGWKDVMKNSWHPEKGGGSLKSQMVRRSMAPGLKLQLSP